jgi:hypothetical protein
MTRSADRSTKSWVSRSGSALVVSLRYLASARRREGRGVAQREFDDFRIA